MNKITILAISAVFAVSMIAITALEVEAKPPSSAICPAENVQHWYSWTFTIGGDNQFIHPTLATLTTTIGYNLKVSTSSDEVVESRQAVVDQLTEIGYEAENTITGVIGPIDIDTIGLSALGNPTLYSTICAEN